MINSESTQHIQTATVQAELFDLSISLSLALSIVKSATFMYVSDYANWLYTFLLLSEKGADVKSIKNSLMFLCTANNVSDWEFSLSTKQALLPLHVFSPWKPVSSSSLINYCSPCG
jgi:hypothetical protein